MTKLQELEQDLKTHKIAYDELVAKKGASHRLYTRNKYNVQELIDTYLRIILSIETEIRDLKSKRKSAK